MKIYGFTRRMQMAMDNRPEGILLHLQRNQRNSPLESLSRNNGSEIE